MQVWPPAQPRATVEEYYLWLQEDIKDRCRVRDFFCWLVPCPGRQTTVRRGRLQAQWETKASEWEAAARKQLGLKAV